MARTDLNVPYEEKDDARRLGAKWDPSRRVWYVPDGTPTDAFGRWVPSVDEEVTLRAQRYFIATSKAECWRCGNKTPVWGLALPSGHREYDDGEWQDIDIPQVLAYSTYLAPPVVAKLREFIALQTKDPKLADCFRLDHSKTMEFPYWMNHCAGCGAKLGDHGLHSEPDAAFFPTTTEAAYAIDLEIVCEEFAGSGGTSYGDPMTSRIMDAE